MEAAFNKAHKQNQRKIMELVEHEDKLNRLYAEKSKAEQKFFSTMKSKDLLQGENRALKQQLAKTTELISKFQETEKSIAQKMESLERQLSLTNTIQTTLEKKLSESKKRENDVRISLETANTQISDVSDACGLCSDD
jgi:E3 ubiquitin-protein ligase BRE1